MGIEPFDWDEAEREFPELEDGAMPVFFPADVEDPVHHDFEELQKKLKLL